MRATVSARATGRDPVRAAAPWLGGAGCLLLTGISVWYALRTPAVTDFAGFDSVLHASSRQLGCVYARPVQLAGARLVPGLRAPATPGALPWHFNEPMVLAYLAYPLARLPLRAALAGWEAASVAALGGCAALLWRQRGPAPPLLSAAVIAALLFNQIANTGLSLAQNDAFLLLACLAGLALLRQGHEFTAGLLVGIVALKPQLVFLAVVFLAFQRRWRVLAGVGLSAAAAWAASLAMVGPACAVLWSHTARMLGEFEVGVGLPDALALLAHATLPAELLFAVLSVAAVWLLWRLRGAGTELGVAVALAAALVVGVHVLAYDVLFCVPLGAVMARRFPWPVFAAGWVLTAALLTDYLTRWYTMPVHLVGLVPLAAVTAALAAERWRPAPTPPPVTAPGRHVLPQRNDDSPGPARASRTWRR